ncbi:MAG: hypothetical protein QNK04_23495 [Myxococcota bacterium]|nr:hypothetical protein [Myxococcota bacterium]
MAAFARVRDGLGIVALAATFALASPGVRIVHAEEATAVAGQCSAGAPVSADAETRAFLDDLRREHLVRRASQASAPEIVVLNNRGYNYGPPPEIMLDQVRAEARAAH